MIKNVEEKIDKDEDATEIIKKENIRLTIEQKEFLAEFLPDENRFFVDNILRVNLLPFF